jgi:hypothetical protein
MQEGNITDRFTRAIDQLGSVKQKQNGAVIPNREIRIGAVYALGEIAKESPKYHIPVMEVLSAYVRKNAIWDEKAKRDLDREAEHIGDDYEYAVDLGVFRNDHVIYAIIKGLS